MSREKGCTHAFKKRVVWVGSHSRADISDVARKRGVSVFAAWVCPRSACVAHAVDECFHVTRRLPVIERREPFA